MGFPDRTRKQHAYTATTYGATATAAAAATSTSGSTAASFATTSTFTSAPALRLLSHYGLRLTSQLDRDLAIQDLFARELRYGTLSLGGSGKVNKRIPNRTSGTRVGRDGRRLPVYKNSVTVALTSKVQIYR